MAISIDIPEQLLCGIGNEKKIARITATHAGIICGMADFLQEAQKLGLHVVWHLPDGASVDAGGKIAELSGAPLELVCGEDRLLGYLGKSSGVATAAHNARLQARKIRVVCGGWKKIRPENRAVLRTAAEIGGLDTRILTRPFIYLDKNYLRIFGCVARAMQAAIAIPDRAVVIQVRGETGDIAEEAVTAAEYGAAVVMVDTGKLEDLRKCSRALQKKQLRPQVELSFAGGVNIQDLSSLQDEDVDVVDIGRVILDAPMLDLRYDIIDRENGIL